MNEVPTNIAVDRWNDVIVSGLMNGDVNFGKPAMAYGGGDGGTRSLVRDSAASHAREPTFTLGGRTSIFSR